MRANEEKRRGWLKTTLVTVAAGAALFYLISKLIRGKRGGTGTSPAAGLQGQPRENQRLTYHERQWLSSIVTPKIGFDGRVFNLVCAALDGLESVKRHLRTQLVKPLTRLATSSTDSAVERRTKVPAGALFYGPPGTGKTRMAHAVAKESKCTLLCVNMAELQSRWHGESLKMVRALFSLARKHAPTIIFIDEIDVFLRDRSLSDQEHHLLGFKGIAAFRMRWCFRKPGLFVCFKPSSHVTGEFLTLWGALGSQEENVVVIGASNRERDIDKAIRRRTVLKFKFDLPDAKERQLMLERYLQGTPLVPDCPLARVSEITEGFSGAELEAICDAVITSRSENSPSGQVALQDFESAIALIRISSSEDEKD